ncbi:cobaltochelatase subunit CobN [Nisaea sp.]|uniref:cobaltochelatase subunit CobN n=1 Tax=Nisaea sp. TaxID=2024842 RepID=UPI002B26C2C9|nr:cobaltochelatase subunit CobN [Nisaea sp.]
MHLLAATPGSVTDGSEAVDLGQTPGDILFLSAADTELACLAQGYAQVTAGHDGPFPSLRLANLMQLGHNLSVDLYVEEMVVHAKMIVVRVIGGTGYWPYGVEQLAAICRKKKIPLAFLPGDDQPDPELTGYGSLDTAATQRLWRYMIEGGIGNAAEAIRFATSLIGTETEWREPAPLPKAGYYLPGRAHPSLEEVLAASEPGAHPAPIVFYRALVQAGNTAPVDALIEAMRAEGLAPVPIFVSSLKDPVSAGLVRGAIEQAPPGVILNATGFAVSKPGAPGTETPFDGGDCTVLQVIFSGGNRENWEASTNGLSARDIAMNVALPEVDGRVLTRAVSFKAEARRDEATECSLVTYEPVPDRIAFAARLASSWAHLRAATPKERKLAIVLANYPNKDGRLGNGVGLDTPAGTVTVLRALAEAGYGVRDIPINGDALIGRLSVGPTNDLSDRASRKGGALLSLETYKAAFAQLPETVRTEIEERWGKPESDPFVSGDAFRLSVLSLGNVLVGIQPARGYNIDPTETYHSPDLVPPHGYLAFYIWLREQFGAHAIVHMGKHGNMEWLPGKSLALSESCYPEAVFGALPNLYPFIVNDPGEGTQAKRRSAAVIIDHLTPPLTRAESYGPLKELEALVDEYYQAAGVDPRRLTLLSQQILEKMATIGIDKDLGLSDREDEAEKLNRLDGYLCELKELQIRDGLHIFGAAPEGRLLDDLLTALVRVPRGKGDGGDASLQRALARDLGLELDGEPFDPLAADMGLPWEGIRPDALADADEQLWRTHGDTIERLELLAHDLIAGRREALSHWQRTRTVLEAVDSHLRPTVASCGDAELKGLLTGLDGRFVAPGSSGAPTRGRPDVLPTGRNFYSVDTRAVPTPAAWQLGWKSACLLLERYRQENGAWPERLAISAWGTANMRTGGDDIAQALALMGVKPEWDVASGRVTGFEILPASVLDRPRVDVTFRVSGFFRDAFPFQIDLLDSAARAVATLDEPAAQNPLAARYKADADAFENAGASREAAEKQAGYRVFGSKPGAYGAGLQAMIDEQLWENEEDLANAYVAWGGYAYGQGTEGEAAHALFESRLKDVELVLHNQDNREHDLLDSDDYYQFEGGITAAIRHLSGAQPTVYHNDHSRPEHPRIRSLEEEVARVVRARVVNPKWIAGVMRHGYKGAFEMAATVDYMFAFAATARCVGDHHFDAVFDAYLGDDKVRTFLERHNPAALKEMAAKLREALDRGLWRPRRNAAHEELTALAG